MILLNRNLTPAGVIRPESMSLNLEERTATAGINIGPEAEIPAAGAWMRDETEPGKGIVWRVKSIKRQIEKETVSLTLEHIINILKDYLITDELAPGDIAGNPKATTCTAEQAFRKALSYQSYWVLGTCEFKTANQYSFNGETVLDAIGTITDSLEDAYWDYDMTQLPFRINVRKLPTDVGCEMRMGRNIQSLQMMVDTSRMYTRFYPVGKNNLKLTSRYVSKNENLYGIICKTETDGSKDTEDALRAWAQERLRKHAEPAVTITISGMDLSRETGEPIDKLTMHRQCRVPLPGTGIQITEKITKLSWSDKIREPDRVSVTLANTKEDVAKIINNANKASASAGRSRAKKDGEDHAWITDTDKYVQLTAEKAFGTDADGKVNWSRVSRLQVGEDGIWGEVKVTEGTLTTAVSRIDQTEKAISAEVTERKSADKTFSGRLDVTSTKVGMVVGEKNGKNFIKAAEIAVSINESTGESEAKIDAQKVYIGNTKSTTVIAGKCSLSDVTADFIKSRIESVSLLNVQAIAGTNGSAYCYLNEFKGNSYKVNISGGGGSVTTNDLCDGVYDLQITSSGNTYTLQKKKIKSSTWEDVGTFSRATTLNGAWDGGVFTVTASPQGQTKKTDLFTAGHWGYASGEIASHYYGSISAHIDGGSTSYSTGAYFEVDGSNLYNNGHDSVVVGEIDLNGNSSATSSSKPTTALSKTPSTISGYKWLQKSDGTWKNLGSFSISTGATHYTVPIYYYSGGSYHKITKNTLCYSDQ